MANATLFIRNLPSNITGRELFKKVFQNDGDIIECVVDSSACTAQVVFSTLHEAKLSFEKHRNGKILDKEMKISLIIDETPSVVGKEEVITENKVMDGKKSESNQKTQSSIHKKKNKIRRSQPLSQNSIKDNEQQPNIKSSEKIPDPEFQVLLSKGKKTLVKRNKQLSSPSPTTKKLKIGHQLSPQKSNGKNNKEINKNIGLIGNKNKNRNKISGSGKFEDFVVTLEY